MKDVRDKAAVAAPAWGQEQMQCEAQNENDGIKMGAYIKRNRGFRTSMDELKPKQVKGERKAQVSKAVPTLQNSNTTWNRFWIQYIN